MLREVLEIWEMSLSRHLVGLLVGINFLMKPGVGCSCGGLRKFGSIMCHELQGVLADVEVTVQKAKDAATKALASGLQTVCRPLTPLHRC